uniref:G domain-containing protein n=1 Tax=Oreochromis aureus TaxID=47969 RepID=A0A668RZ57_OREAU
WSKENDLQDINTYQPHNSEIQYLRILLCGPTGSGKSSDLFIVTAKHFSFTVHNFQNPKSRTRDFLPFYIKQVMKGHVKDNRDYNENPGLSDKVHVLVSVISVSQAKTLIDLNNLTNIIFTLSFYVSGIPQMLLQTKIDEAFLEVKEDIKNVYKSSPLKEQMEKVSQSLGIPVNCSFPVKNYHSEIHTDDNTDTLILSTLRKMIDFGEDFVNSRTGKYWIF